MLLEVNNEDYDIGYEIRKRCGKEYSIIERIINKNFGSFRYKLLSISKNKFNTYVILRIKTSYEPQT